MLLTATFFEPTTVVMTTTATTTTFADQQSLQDWRRRCWVLRKSRQAASWRKSTNQIQCAIAMRCRLTIYAQSYVERVGMCYIYIVVQCLRVVNDTQDKPSANTYKPNIYTNAKLYDMSFDDDVASARVRAHHPCASHICYVERRGGAMHSKRAYIMLCAYTHCHHSLRASSRIVHSRNWITKEMTKRAGEDEGDITYVSTVQFRYREHSYICDVIVKNCSSLLGQSKWWIV